MSSNQVETDPSQCELDDGTEIRSMFATLTMDAVANLRRPTDQKSRVTFVKRTDPADCGQCSLNLKI